MNGWTDATSGTGTCINVQHYVLRGILGRISIIEMSHPPIYNKQSQIAVALSDHVVEHLRPTQIEYATDIQMWFLSDKNYKFNINIGTAQNLFSHELVRSFVTRDKICNRTVIHSVVVKWCRKVKPYGRVMSDRTVQQSGQ